MKTSRLRIRTALGEEIDLAEVRRVAEEAAAADDNQWLDARDVLCVVDALEAMLAIEERVFPIGITAFACVERCKAKGFNNALAAVRQAAGVIEENGT